MAWKVEIDSAAARDLDRLDRHAARRILAFLHGRIAALDDPRSIGEALKGNRLPDHSKILEQSSFGGCSSPARHCQCCAVKQTERIRMEHMLAFAAFTQLAKQC